MAVKTGMRECVWVHGNLNTAEEQFGLSVTELLGDLHATARYM